MTLALSIYPWSNAVSYLLTVASVFGQFCPRQWFLTFVTNWWPCMLEFQLLGKSIFFDNEISNESSTGSIFPEVYSLFNIGISDKIVKAPTQLLNRSANWMQRRRFSLLVNWWIEHILSTVYFEPVCTVY